MAESIEFLKKMYALHVAVLKGDRKLAVKFLDDRDGRALFLAENDEGRIALDLAVERENKEMIGDILDTVEVRDMKMVPHRSFWRDAMAKDDTAYVEGVVRYGDSLDDYLGIYGTPLQVAALYGSEAAVKVLLKYGANVNKNCGFYGTPLIAAARHGRYAIVELLLKAGADLDASNDFHASARAAAGARKQFEVITLLDVERQRRYIAEENKRDKDRRDLMKKVEDEILESEKQKEAEEMRLWRMSLDEEILDEKMAEAKID